MFILYYLYSTTTTPWQLKYLGFGFYKDKNANEWKCRPHPDSVKKFKSRLKGFTCRKMPGTVTSKIANINQVTRRWINYYALGSMKKVMADVDVHLRTRLRVIIWKQWKSQRNDNGDCRNLGLEKILQEGLHTVATAITGLLRKRVLSGRFPKEY